MSDFFVCAMLNTYTFVFFLFLSGPAKLSYNSFKHSELKKQKIAYTTIIINSLPDFLVVRLMQFDMVFDTFFYLPAVYFIAEIFCGLYSE